MKGDQFILHRNAMADLDADHPFEREHLAGHDLTYQAEAGLLTPPAMPAALVADLSGAQRAAVEAINLLFVRERTGAAGHAVVALSDCAKLFAEPLRHGLTAPTGVLGGACAAYGRWKRSKIFARI